MEAYRYDPETEEREFRKKQEFDMKLEMLIDNINYQPYFSKKCAQQRAILHGRRQMRTNVTSHQDDVTGREMYGSMYAAERHEAFTSSKLASLRRSPCRIVWPQKPIEPDPNQEPSTSSKAQVVTIAEEPESRSRSSSSSTSTVPPQPSIEFGGKKVLNFWDNANGDMRVDAHYYGSPRFDPYCSPWTKDERRCFFLNFKPAHQKIYDVQREATKLAKQFDTAMSSQQKLL